MKTQVHNPATAPTPASAYAQAIGVTAASRWMIISGQVAMKPDGTPVSGVEEQMRQCFRNLFAVLADANMQRDHIVKLTVFLTDARDVALYRSIRDEMMGGHLAASTLLIIDGLANPDWRVEIEATACD